MSSHLVVDNTLGAAFCGFAVSCMVFGIYLTQVYAYFDRYPLDRLAYKYLVIVLSLLETVDQCFIGYTVYYYAISNFDSPLVLIVGSVLWSLLLQLLLGAFVGAIVKLCFAMRVWRFSNHNIPLTTLLILLIFAQLGLAIAYTVKAFYLERLVFIDSLTLLATLTLGLGVITDVTTAGSLCFYLRRMRTGHPKSDSLVSTLTRYAVNTGLLTSAVSLCTLVLYNIMPHNFIFVGFYFVLCKMFGISFMTTLNTRKAVRGKGTDQEDSPIPNNNAVNVKPLTPSFSNDKTESQLEVGEYHGTFFLSDGCEYPFVVQ